MQKESIKKAIEILTEEIYASDIDNMDKLELVINLNHFLQNYDEAIKVKVKKKEKKYE